MGERENVRKDEWTTYRKVLPSQPDPQQTRHSPPKGCVGTTPPPVPRISKNVKGETDTSVGRCGWAFGQYWDSCLFGLIAAQQGIGEKKEGFFECIGFGFWCMKDRGTCTWCTIVERCS